MTQLEAAVLAFKSRPTEISAGLVLRAADKVLDTGFSPVGLVDAQDAIKLVTDWLLRTRQFQRPERA